MELIRRGQAVVVGTALSAMCVWFLQPAWAVEPLPPVEPIVEQAVEFKCAFTDGQIQVQAIGSALQVNGDISGKGKVKKETTVDSSKLKLKFTLKPMCVEVIGGNEALSLWEVTKSNEPSLIGKQALVDVVDGAVDSVGIQVQSDFGPCASLVPIPKQPCDKGSTSVSSRQIDSGPLPPFFCNQVPFPTCDGFCEAGTECRPDSINQRCACEPITSDGCGSLPFPSCGTGGCELPETCQPDFVGNLCRCAVACSDKTFPVCTGGACTTGSCQPDSFSSICVCRPD
jgi:hypothetical protein